MPNTPENWVKVLAIRMTPYLDLRNPDSMFEHHGKLSEMTARVLGELLALMESKFQSHHLKLYADTPADMSLLMSAVSGTVKSEIGKQLNIKADSHGRWLTITHGLKRS